MFLQYYVSQGTLHIVQRLTLLGMLFFFFLCCTERRCFHTSANIFPLVCILCLFLTTVRRQWLASFFKHKKATKCFRKSQYLSLISYVFFYCYSSFSLLFLRTIQLYSWETARQLTTLQPSSCIGHLSPLSSITH